MVKHLLNIHGALDSIFSTQRSQEKKKGRKGEKKYETVGRIGRTFKKGTRDEKVYYLVLY